MARSTRASKAGVSVGAAPGGSGGGVGQLYAALARVGTALGSPHRIALLDALAQRPETVERLAAQLRIPVASASQHLRKLAAAGLVRGRRAGSFVSYALAGDDVVRLVEQLRAVGHAHLADLRQAAADLLGAEPRGDEVVDAAELAKRMRAGEVVVIDVRSREDYEAGHLRGAISVPLDELARRVKTLAKDRPVVAYCRGPYCATAGEAVTRLRRLGYEAKHLRSGYPQWRAEGFPVTLPAGGGVAPAKRRGGPLPESVASRGAPPPPRPPLVPRRGARE